MIGKNLNQFREIEQQLIGDKQNQVLEIMEKQSLVIKQRKRFVINHNH